ncbi:MAG: TetR/AcrR family transcriptional regulator [bacterium]|nr:TetR/AcrR family transcriptional regulator [bacterium]
MSKSEKTKAAILSSALKLFQEKGFEKTTMRDIAGDTGLALGSAYYYFKTKEELVLAFYLETQKEVKKDAEEIIKKNKDFRKRMVKLFLLQFERLQPYKNFLNVLIKSASDLESPLSPFSNDAAEIRKETIDILSGGISGTNVKIPAKLAEQLPYLLWLLQMGLIAFWLYDKSNEYDKTKNMTGDVVKLLYHYIKIQGLPLTNTINTLVTDILANIQDITGESRT